MKKRSAEHSAKISAFRRAQCALPYGPIVERKLRTFKSNASKTNREWLLSDDVARSLLVAACHYCGSESQLDHPYIPGYGRYYPTAGVNGIDRMDNDKGYVDGNVVTCCATCNFAKRDMSVVEFEGWIARVYRHILRRNTMSNSSSWDSTGGRPINPDVAAAAAMSDDEGELNAGDTAEFDEEIPF